MKIDDVQFFVLINNLLRVFW